MAARPVAGSARVVRAHKRACERGASAARFPRWRSRLASHGRNEVEDPAGVGAASTCDMMGKSRRKRYATDEADEFLSRTVRAFILLGGPGEASSGSRAKRKGRRSSAGP